MTFNVAKCRSLTLSLRCQIGHQHRRPEVMQLGPSNRYRCHSLHEPRVLYRCLSRITRPPSAPCFGLQVHAAHCNAPLLLPPEQLHPPHEPASDGAVGPSDGQEQSGHGK